VRLIRTVKWGAGGIGRHYTGKQHNALGAGLWIGAFGIFLQAVTGAKGYPKVPPGILILAAIGLVVYLTSRWAWTALLGLFLVGLIWVGVFTTPGTAYRLQHPQDVGPLIGTLVQLAGLMLALIAGIAVIVVRFLHPNRSQSIPQG
jgi:hypothetical protein